MGLFKGSSCSVWTSFIGIFKCQHFTFNHRMLQIVPQRHWVKIQGFLKVTFCHVTQTTQKYHDIVKLLYSLYIISKVIMTYNSTISAFSFISFAFYFLSLLSSKNLVVNSKHIFSSKLSLPGQAFDILRFWFVCEMVEFLNSDLLCFNILTFQCDEL